MARTLAEIAADQERLALEAAQLEKPKLEEVQAWLDSAPAKKFIEQAAAFAAELAIGNTRQNLRNIIQCFQAAQQSTPVDTYAADQRLQAAAAAMGTTEGQALQ